MKLSILPNPNPPKFEKNKIYIEKDGDIEDSAIAMVGRVSPEHLMIFVMEQEFGALNRYYDNKFTCIEEAELALEREGFIPLPNTRVVTLRN